MQIALCIIIAYNHARWRGRWRYQWIHDQRFRGVGMGMGRRKCAHLHGLNGREFSALARIGFIVFQRFFHLQRSSEHKWLIHVGLPLCDEEEGPRVGLGVILARSQFTVMITLNKPSAKRNHQLMVSKRKHNHLSSKIHNYSGYSSDTDPKNAKFLTPPPPFRLFPGGNDLYLGKFSSPCFSVLLLMESRPSISFSIFSPHILSVLLFLDPPDTFSSKNYPSSLSDFVLIHQVF